jgi:hypothetical protein
MTSFPSSENLNGMLKLRRDLPRTAALSAELVRTFPIMIGLVFFISFGLNRFFEEMARELAFSDQGPWMAQVCEFLVSLIEGFCVLLIGTYFLAFRKTTLSWKEFFKIHFNPLMAESLRSLASILLWSLFFLIPGFIAYVRLSLVGFIVVLDPTFKTNPDALKRSRELTRHCWIRLAGIIMLLTLAEAFFELTPNLLHVGDIFSSFVFECANFLCSLFGFCLLYVIFENLRHELDAQNNPRLEP